MEKIVIKAPRDKKADYDYVAFSFNGYHSYEDLNILRVSDGKEYKKILVPENKSITTSHKANHGTILVKTHDTLQHFSIKIVFDDLTEKQFQQLKRVFNGTAKGPLWFAEEPYKVYIAKLEQEPKIKFLCFDENNDGKLIRKYRGEGTLNFITCEPYAYSPDEIQLYDEEKEEYITNHVPSTTKISRIQDDKNPLTFSIRQNLQEKLKITLQIPAGEKYNDVRWDSKTGLVSGVKVNEKVSNEDVGDAIPSPLLDNTSYEVFSGYKAFKSLLPGQPYQPFEFGECPFTFEADLGFVENASKEGLKFVILDNQDGTFRINFPNSNLLPDYLQLTCLRHEKDETYKKYYTIIEHSQFNTEKSGQYYCEITADFLKGDELIQVRGKKEGYEDFLWPSNSSPTEDEQLKKDEDNLGIRVPIPYVGQSYGRIEPGPFEVVNIRGINYHYFYY